MALAYVAQRVSGTSAQTTSVTFSPATNCTPGALLVLLFAGRATATPSVTVTDTKGNTWTVDAGPIREPGNGWCFIASTVQDVGALLTTDTITVTITGGSPTVPMFQVQEFTGQAASPFDVPSTAATSATQTAQTGTSASTSQANEVVVNVFGWDDVATSGLTVGAGYTQFTTIGFTNGGKTLSSQYKIVAAIGTQSGSMTTTGIAQGVAGALATYKEAVAAATLSPPFDSAPRVRRSPILTR